MTKRAGAPLLALALGVASAAARAEITLPAPSPAASISQTIGVTNVTIDYHRPGVKGRKVWGDLVPYEKVWRLGANEATRITFTTPVRIKGKELPAGSYAVFAVPKPGVFTIVLNAVPKQWGSYFYDEKKDVLRFDIQPEKAPMTEWMTFAIVPTGKGTARVDWAWERLRFSFDVEVDVDGMVWKTIDDALAKEGAAWDDYLSAAQFAWREKARLPEAMGWVDKSIALKESFWSYELKGRLLAHDAKYSEAIALVEKAKELAKGKAPQAYVDGLDTTLAEWRGKAK